MKQDRLTIRLDADIRAKLHAKASELGLDDAAYARMLIFKDINGVADDRRGVSSRRFGGEVAADGFLTRPDPRHSTGLDGGSPDGFPEIDDGLRAEEMDIPADPDGGVPQLDAILGATPSFLDEMMSNAMPASQPAPTYRQAMQRQSSRSYRQRPAQPLYGPGSMTRAIGVNDMAIGGNTYGDGTGNVMRDNMRHFGIVGTRAR